MSGKLLVVATPLGNLDDISSRALATLREVDLVCCEDTRRTSKLLSRYGIVVAMLSCHRFNERQRLEAILDRLRSGESVALVSDGGTPAISDPGALLVQAALDAGIAVSPLPGPSAAAALLSASGLAADRYVFEGFLPHRAGERRRRLRQLRAETRTVVFFEAPHRLLDCLRDVEAVMGDRRLVLGRELTKVHETILAGTAAELSSRLGSVARGEITIAMAGSSGAGRAGATEAAATRVLDTWRRSLEQTGGDRRAALRLAARELGMKRPELFRYLSELEPDAGAE